MEAAATAATAELVLTTAGVFKAVSGAIVSSGRENNRPWLPELYWWAKPLYSQPRPPPPLLLLLLLLLLPPPLLLLLLLLLLMFICFVWLRLARPST